MSKVVVWDFDGPIVNSYDMAYQVASKIFPHIDQESYRSIFRGNFYENAHKYGYHYTPETEKIFFSNYQKGLMNLSPILGIDKVLASLPSNTHIISSSSEQIMQKYLAKYDLAQYFDTDAIWGYETARKKTDKFVMLADKLPEHEILFITDTTGDIAEAREVVGSHNLDIATVGVSWGWMYRDWLEEMKPAYLVDEVVELELIVQKFLKK